MKQITIICKNCKWETKIMYNELEENTKCILCQSQMKIKDLDELYDMLKPYWINSFAHDISVLGNKKVWEIIEGFKNPKTRIAYRKLFFEAGGENK